LESAETGQRGFVITGEAEYLAPYYAGRKAAIRRLSRLTELTGDDPHQQQRIVAMRPLVEKKLTELEQVIELRRSAAGGFEAARAVVLSDEGRIVMATLRARVADMDKAERRRLADRARTSAVATRTATVTNVLGLAGSLLLLVAAFGVWRGRTRERERAAALLDLVVREAAIVLDVEPGAVDTSRPLTALGLDSLMALELRNRLQAALAVKVAVGSLWKTPTVAALAEQLLSIWLVARVAQSAPQPSAAQPAEEEHLRL
jgi:methyl-accepting chemotaxis protein